MANIDLSKLTPSHFPPAEDDEFEFKSSLATDRQIIEKLNLAASAFANTGGGCFLWGVDKTGNADGGVEPRIRRQELRDWFDQIIHRVDPAPKYEVRTYTDKEGRGSLESGKVIAALAFPQSVAGPHMAADKKYYIRAGAHTVEAGHFIVEAIWARRQIGRPILVPIVRVIHRPDSRGQLHYHAELGIVNLTTAPAVAVEIDIEPKVRYLEQWKAYFPVRLPLVDLSNPYHMYMGPIEIIDETISDATKVSIAYKDLAGNDYTGTNEESLLHSIPPNFRRASRRPF
jgi:hypothetical protein